MPDVKLLSNGNYHVMMDARGSGWSRWKGLAVTRWREDAVLDTGGTYFYLRDEASGDVWSATARPTEPGSAACHASFEAGRAEYARRDHDLDVRMTVAVDASADAELRRLRLVNRSPRPRTLSVTSYAEIVLAPPATDASHLAFSKIFVETEIDAALGAVLATRRPSAPEQPRAWCFHRAVVEGRDAGLSYETDRLRFVGRGRDLSAPAALDGGEPLSGSAGPVLDAIASIRATLRMEPGATCTLDFWTGVATTRDECLALARRCSDRAAGDAILEQVGASSAATLARLGADRDAGKIYERLAGAIVVADAALRGAPADIERNRRGQSGLWGFGISGDLPVVWLQVADGGALDAVAHVVQAHAYWEAHGIRTELMITSGSHGKADAALLDRVTSAVHAAGAAAIVGKAGGIFLRDDATLDDGDRTLLQSVARIAAAGPWATWSARVTGMAAPAVDAQPRPPSPGAALPSPSAGDLLDFNGHGGFTPDRREYAIEASISRMTPAPWTNVIANASFGTLVSESGSASTWSENAQQFRLTPWSNDPVGDANTEAFYIRDEASGELWSPTLLPAGDGGAYRARHGFGYSRFEHLSRDIESELCVFVAIDAPVKFSMLTLRNRSSTARKLAVTGYVEWVLGDERAKTLMQVVTSLDADTGAVLARNGYNTDFEGRTAFFDVEGTDRSATGDRAEFLGRSGSLRSPEALARGALSGRVGAALDPCAALRVTVELAPGAEETIVFRLGAGRSEADAQALVRRWRGNETARAALDAARAHWRDSLDVVQVRTPDPAVDALANGWLLYQVIASRLWARTAFYQSSGAYGFRDQLQDVMALVHAEPGLVREHLLRAAGRQFIEGDVQHWWHPPSGKGIRTRCSDDYLWLPFVACRYVEVTGDDAVLDEPCPFLEQRVLEDGEQSDYELPTVSAQSASLYEHCVRAIRHGLAYGAHGLPLMGAGDWNDGMNLVGAGGKGESVWLAFFLVAVLKRFAPIARSRGDAQTAQLCDDEATGLATRIEASAWDGAWYQRAWFDDGTPLGTAGRSECRIDSIAQSWSVLSGAAPRGRATQAMASVHEHLVHADTRLVQLLDPPFDTSVPSPGYIQGYVPGVRENGGQYTHAAVWATLAFAALGDADRAWELFGLLAPTRHGADADAIATYKVEPYVVAGDVYAWAPHAGRGGWTWYTGSAGWMYQLLVEALLGLQRRGNQLRMCPLLPRDWPGFEMRYRHGGSTYEIAVRRASAPGSARVTQDGIVMADGAVALLDDGKTHAVLVDAWHEPRPTAA